MKKIKGSIYSSKVIEDLLVRIEDLTERLERKENRSLARTAWDFLKKPVIGKPRKK